MASKNLPIDMFDMPYDEDLSLANVEVNLSGWVSRYFPETKLFRIYCTFGEGDRINLDSGRTYEWNEIVEVIKKFVEMLESYPGMIRSKEAFGKWPEIGHLAIVWEQWTTENYPDLSAISSATFNTKNFITGEELLDIKFSPPLSGDIIINIAKKHRMKGLKELGVEAVVDNLKEVGDIQKLNLPSSVAEELKKEFGYYCEKFQVKKLKILSSEVVWKHVDISKYMELAIMKSIGENQLDGDWSDEMDGDDDSDENDSDDGHDWSDDSDSDVDFDPDNEPDDEVLQALLRPSGSQDIILDPEEQANYYYNRALEKLLEEKRRLELEMKDTTEIDELIDSFRNT